MKTAKRWLVVLALCACDGGGEPASGEDPTRDGLDSPGQASSAGEAADQWPGADAGMSGSGDPAAPDSAAPEPAASYDMSDVFQRVAGSVSMGGTCAAVCAAEGYQCEPGCDEPGATYAGVSVHVDENGAGQEQEIESCATEVPAELQRGGETLELGQFSCCCLGPWWSRITELPGSPTAPQSCDTICQAQSLICDPDRDWGLDEIGGGRSSYVDDSDGAITRLVTLGCGAIPLPDFSDNGRHWVLSRYRCACHPPPPEGAMEPAPPQPEPAGGSAELYEPCASDGECVDSLFCDASLGYCTRACVDFVDCPQGDCNQVRGVCRP